MAKRDAPLEPSNQDIWLSQFSVQGMDCPSEEQLIRIALRDIAGVNAMEFDLDQRQVRITHAGPVSAPVEK